MCHDNVQWIIRLLQGFTNGRCAIAYSRRTSIWLTVIAATSGNLVIQVQHGFSLKKK